MGLEFYAKKLELKCGRKPLTHLRILSRKVNLIQIVLLKDHSSSLWGVEKDDKCLPGKPARCPGRLGASGGGRERGAWEQGGTDELIFKLSLRLSWWAP